jgi:dienelactone hydrolase
MVCFHQCFTDCDIGKESVVGKVVERPDQAYALELVREGFVVIAPDVLHCGERRIPSLRQEGQRLHCGGRFTKLIRRSWKSKMIFDGTRAIDLLQSLDFVDSERIGTIGHSMGASIAFITMAYDERIKAGIMSGGPDPDEFSKLALASIAPRLLMQLQGSYDYAVVGEIEKQKELHNSAKEFYQEASCSQNLVLRIARCGHHFLDEFKWEAYARLKEYFGLQDIKDSVLLEDVLKKAREGCSWVWKRWIKEKGFPEITSSSKCYVTANKERLTLAFSLMFAHLCQKRPQGSSLVVNVSSGGKNCHVTCTIVGGDDNLRVAHDTYYQMRPAEQIFFENSASLKRENTHNEIKYVVNFKNRAGE